MQHFSPGLPLSVVQTLVLYALCEHQLGHASKIVVSSSGYDFTVADDGRGHSVSRTVEGAPYLDFIYGHLEFPFGRSGSPPVQLQGLGMSLINQLCSRLDVTVRRPTCTLSLCFEQGRLAKHEFFEAANSETGNTLSGALLPALAPQPIDEGALAAWLAAVQRVNPSLELVFNGTHVKVAASGA